LSEFVYPDMSLYVFTGLESEEDLIKLLGVAPDDAWTKDEDSGYADTDTGKKLYIVGGPNATGVRYNSPLNGDPECGFEDRLTALLDRVEPIADRLAELRRTHSYPNGNLEVVLRFHAVVGPGFRTGLVIPSSCIDRVIGLGADLFAAFPFTPFDQRDGNRYRPRRSSGNETQAG